jgi:hypothetical protein
MPVAVIFVSILMMLVLTPSEASESCMSKTEARRHFGSVHIYWHGQDHCWGTRRHRQIQNAKRKRQMHEVKRKIDQPKWHASMSEMLPDDEPVWTPWVDRWVDIEPPQLPIVARWLDIAEVKPPPVIERKSEPMVSPAMLLVFFATVLALTLATIELLFRGMIRERPQS